MHRTPGCVPVHPACGMASHSQQECHVNSSPPMIWKPTPVMLWIHPGFWVYSAWRHHTDVASTVRRSREGENPFFICPLPSFCLRKAFVLTKHHERNESCYISVLAESTVSKFHPDRKLLSLCGVSNFWVCNLEMSSSRLASWDLKVKLPSLKEMSFTQY